MNISRRVLVAILFITIVTLVGMLLWPFILNEIITPTALFVWLLLRFFVLSIDQHYFWGAIIFITFMILYRLPPQGSKTLPTDEFSYTNETVQTVEYWRNLYLLPNFNAHDKSTLKRELVRLLASLYASKQHASTSFVFYEALERGQIPLPENIHAFLFPEKPQTAGRSFKWKIPISSVKLLQSVLEAPRNWIRRGKAQERAEYYRMIDEIFSFLETSLEMENDAAKFTPNEH